ncbi:MAG: hypothetical protein JWN18_628 [Parcubacteria group bacterium]|nr:hypothetical protein [Parcubacteria group bacterium]
MESLLIALMCLQALGACLGAIAVVRGELAYVHASRDGAIDDAEAAHLRHIAQGLRYGMSLALISSLLLVVLAYFADARTQPAFMSSYWTFISISLLVTVDSWALSRKRVSFALGSAFLFAGWWFLVYLTFGLLPPLTFGAAAAVLVVVTTIFYALLSRTRLLRPRSIA